MPTIVRDTYAIGSDGFIFGRAANIVGGTWSGWNTVYGTADLAIVAATGRVLCSTDAPFWLINSTDDGGLTIGDTLEFTPFADNWIVAGLLRVSGSTGYNIILTPSGVGIHPVTDAVSTPFPGPIATAAAILAAGERGSHTFTVGHDDAGNFTASVDGVPVTFTGDTNDLTFASGKTGWGGRSITSSEFQADTPGGPAPALSSPTGTATGKDAATVGFTTDQAVSGALPAYFLTLPAATAAPANAAALIADGATVSQTTGGTTPTRALTGLTPGTALRTHMCQPGSNVVSSASYTPTALALTGSLSAQTCVAGGALTWAGANPSTLVSSNGIGTRTWSISNAGGTGLSTINGTTGVVSGTPSAGAGSYTVTLTVTDQSTAGSEFPQTETITFGLTISAAAATGVTMSGPSSGVVGVASTNFSIGVTPGGGTISGTLVVTPSDGGGGGSFTPSTVNLTTGSPTATFTYTPGSTGAKTISVTNNGGLTNPSNITYTASGAAATAVTLNGPSSGVAGAASSNFTVGANGVITGTVAVTPAATGCTFSPASVNISAGSPTATFTCTPAAPGAKSITLTNNGGLSNPSAFTYTASGASPATSVTVTLLAADGVTPLANRSDLNFSFFDQPLQANRLAPTAKGAVPTTNSSGVTTINITGTALLPGATGSIDIDNSDGSTSQSPSAIGVTAVVVVA